MGAMLQHMPFHGLVWVAASAVLLAACGSSDAAEYLTEDIPPCTPLPGSSVDPCEPDVKIPLSASGGASAGWIFSTDTPRTVRDYLDGGSLTFIPHIVVRSTFLQDTVRCESEVPNREPNYVEPGLFQDAVTAQCYADVRVNGYIVGAGPSQVTVLLNFVHYWDGMFAADAAHLNSTHDEAVEGLRRALGIVLEEGPERAGDGIYGREMVLFIGPAHSEATEVWEVFQAWDVQQQEDGTAIAVHPSRDAWRAARPDDYQTHRSALEMTLPDFSQAVTTAHQARMTEYGGRIAPDDIQSRKEGVDLPMLVTDANQLRQYYMDTGAYDHPDGPPAQPPPAP